MSSLSSAKAWGGTAAGAAIGPLAGAAVHLGSSSDPIHRSAAAIVLTLLLTPCAAVALDELDRALWQRLVRPILMGAVAGVGALLVAGGSLSGLASVLVPGATCVLAVGVAAALARLRWASSSAVFAGASLPFLLGASLFAANPLVEWRAEDGATQSRAGTALQINPIAAALSLDGGVGLDWQRTRWLYDGADDSGRGLSVVGQFYPARGPSPWNWSSWAGLIGAALILVGPRSSNSSGPSLRPLDGV
jgi:hypothetical protein